MAEKVLQRVCYGDSSPENPLIKTSKITTNDAILHNHRRQRVKGADYPAIVPHEGASVRGTYVTGLTDADVWRLDIFEGSDYRRDKVKPRLLTQVDDKEGKETVEGKEVEAETYIFSAGPDELEDSEWDFEEFQREKLCFWVGAEGSGEYAGRPSIIG